MSQVGKLYKFYLKKIWQKNWGRILIFTILIGVVWWFVIPFTTYKAIEKLQERRSDEEIPQEKEKDSFSKAAKIFFGGEVEYYDSKAGKKTKVKPVEKVHLKIQEELEEDRKLEEEKGKGKLSGMQKMYGTMFASCNFLGLSFPFNANNVYFFQQTDGTGHGFPNYAEGKAFLKLLFDIAWWNLTGFVVLYWFIFEVFDKTFFFARGDGEESAVLTMTPGVKRSDLIWGKVLSFLTFYFLINIVLFLIPYGIYYFWMSPTANISWFSLLALISVIVAPLLFFGLVFAPYLFLGSLMEGGKWIFSALITFFPILWGVLKAFSSWSWLYTIENTLFDPIWFTIISLVVGIFFLTLYYLRYQEEDLS